MSETGPNPVGVFMNAWAERFDRLQAEADRAGAVFQRSPSHMRAFRVLRLDRLVEKLQEFHYSRIDTPDDFRMVLWLDQLRQQRDHAFAELGPIVNEARSRVLEPRSDKEKALDPHAANEVCNFAEWCLDEEGKLVAWAEGKARELGIDR